MVEGQAVSHPGADIMGNDRKAFAQDRHLLAPAVPELRPAVEQDDGRALPMGHVMDVNAVDYCGAMPPLHSSTPSSLCTWHRPARFLRAPAKPRPRSEGSATSGRCQSLPRRPFDLRLCGASAYDRAHARWSNAAPLQTLSGRSQARRAFRERQQTANGGAYAI